MSTKTRAPYFALASGAAVMLLGIIGFELVYWQRTYPGVRLGNLDMGGAGVVEIERVIRDREGQLSALTINWGTNSWVIDTGEFGLSIDEKATSKKVLEVGRSGGLQTKGRTVVAALRGETTVEPVYSLDYVALDRTIGEIAGQIDIPAREPEVTVDVAAGKVNVAAGENGQAVDVRTLRERTLARIANLSNSVIEVPVAALKPKLEADQIELTRERMEKLLAGQLKLILGGENLTWEIQTDQIATWLDPAGGWRRGRIEEWISELAAGIDRPAQNASFTTTNAGKVENFRPGKNGYRVLQTEMVNRIVGYLSEMEVTGVKNMEMVLAVEEVEPAISTGDVNSLGIHELLGKGESWYAGSITNRIFNLHKAAEAISGIVVPPGEIFSFNEAVGEISTATGYKQAFIIKEGQTILGDGGGVCQTSSTLFRAVLTAGLPIEARTAHAYRVSYYEQNYQVGFDATVFQPAPDFKFRNDTPGHVLIQMEFDEKKKYLAFSIYGTSDGRKAEISKSRVWDVVAPPPDLYIDDPTLPMGEVKQTEHAARGSKVAFDWKVTRGNEVLIERTFYSNYKPWQAVYLRGIKTN